MLNEEIYGVIRTKTNPETCAYEFLKMKLNPEEAVCFRNIELVIV